jgi:hypothetical protein
MEARPADPTEEARDTPDGDMRLSPCMRRMEEGGLVSKAEGAGVWVWWGSRGGDLAPAPGGGVWEDGGCTPQPRR